MKNRNDIEADSSKQIKAGAIISYITVILNMVLGFVYTPWMLKMIGDSDYGLYSTATALITMFTLDFGLSAGVSRFLSKYNAEHDQESINNCLGLVYKLYFAITVVIFIVLTIVFFHIERIYTGFTPEEIHKFRVVYVIASISTLINFPFITLNGILTSYEKFAALKICGLAAKLMTVVFTVMALLCGQGVYMLVAVNALSTVIIITVKLGIIKRKTPIKVNFSYRSRKMLKDVFGFSIWSSVGSIAQRFIFNFMPTILGMVANTVAITKFSLASAIEGYVWTFSEALNGLFLPKVSRITASNSNDKNVLPLMIKVGRINLMIVSFLVLGFAVLGRDFIMCWLGEGYEEVYMSALLLIVPTFITQPQQIANTAIIALNKVKIQAIIMCATSAVNVILSYFLSRIIGVVGAAVSVCVAYFLKAVCLNILYYKELKINIFEFFKRCHIKIILTLIIVFVLGICEVHFIPINGVLGFLLKGVCFTVIYITVVWTIYVNGYEKELVKSVINSMKRKVIKR